MIKNILLKLFFIFKFYIILNILSILFIIIYISIYKKIDIKDEVFYEKVINNEPYYLKDYINDIPWMLSWSNDNLKKPTNVILLFIISFLTFMSKSIIFVITILISPFINIYFIYRYSHKKEIKLKNNIIYNSNLKILLTNIFIKIPLAVNYKINYDLFKILFDKKKKKKIISLKLIINRIIITNIIGMPLWMLVNIDLIYKKIKRIMNIKFKKKKKLRIPFIYFKLCCIEINNSLYKNKNSYFNIVNRLRIYFIEDKVVFNPNRTKKALEEAKKRDKILSKDNIQMSLESKNGKRSNSHFIHIKNKKQLEDDYENSNRILDPIIFTGKPYDRQRSFIIGTYIDKNNQERTSYAVYSDLADENVVKEKHARNFELSMQEMTGIDTRVDLIRGTDPECGLNVQDEKSSSSFRKESDFFYNNALEYAKLKNNKTLEKYATEKIEDYKKENLSSSEVEQIQMQLNELSISGYSTKHSKINLNETENRSFRESINNLEYMSKENALNQEYTLTDNQISDNLEEAKEKYLEKLSSPSKGNGQFTSIDDI